MVPDLLKWANIKDEQANFNKIMTIGALSQNQVQAKVMPAGETAFLSMKKAKLTLHSPTIEVQIV